MTSLDGVTKKKAAEPSAEQQGAAELVRLAQEQGLSLTGPDGLLKQLTKTVLETALNEEMTEHLGYEKHDPTGCGDGQYPQRHLGQDGAHRHHRPCRDRRAARSVGDLRATDRQEASTSVVRGGRDRLVAVRQRPDDAGDLGALRRDLRRIAPRMRAFRSDARRPSAVETNLLQYIVAEKFIGARGHVLRSRKDIGAVGVR